MGLKIRIERIEEFLLDQSNPKDYIQERDQDSLFDEAKEIVQEHDAASASLLQRRLSIGYTRAARLLDQLEEAGVIGPGEGSKPRKVIKK